MLFSEILPKDVSNMNATETFTVNLESVHKYVYLRRIYDTSVRDKQKKKKGFGRAKKGTVKYML